MNTRPPSKRYLLSSKFAVVALVLLVAGAGFVIWKKVFQQSDVRKALHSLQSAYREQRPLEARISSLDYAPFAVTRNSGPVPHDDGELHRAELTLLDVKREEKTAEALHGLGQVYLAQRRFDDAIREFDEALRLDSTNPIILGDMGAAWLEKAKSDLDPQKQPGDQGGGKAIQALAKSLDYLNYGLAQDSGSLTTLFNRALCFQYLRLPIRAQEDWREYLSKDKTSRWSAEAQHNFGLLQQQVDAAAPKKEQVLNNFLAAYDAGNEEKAWNLISVTRDDLSGTSVSQQLLDAYLDSSLKGDQSGASRKLAALSYVGDLEVKRGDEYYIAHLAELCRSLKPAQQAMLAKARDLMKTGYGMYEQSADTREMLKVFEQAANAFQQAGDTVEVHHARYWIAYCSLSGVSTERGLALLNDLAAECERLQYRWLLMRTTQSISSAKYNLKEYSRSIEYSREALKQADKVGDQIGVFNALDFLTEIYRAINNHEQAMNSISRSQPLLDCCAFNPIKVWRHYGIVALAFYSAGSHDAAIEYQREAVRRAVAANDPEMICLSDVNLGLMLGKLGQYDEALKSAKHGYETAATGSDETRGKRLMAYLSLQTGNLYRESGDCDNALNNYDQAITLYESLKFPPHLYQAHKGRVLCYLKQEKDALAGAELQTALDLIDQNRSTIFEGDNRNKFFDIEQNIYDLAIEFAYETEKDGVKAFGHSESSRARSLLDLMLAGNAKQTTGDPTADTVFDPLPLSQIKQRLPELDQILEYTVLDDRVLIWIVNKNDAQVRESKIDRTELESRVTSYLRSISDPDSGEELSRAGKDLFDLLINPVVSLLDPQKQLNIVPDKILNSLPFDSLISTRSGKFLVEEFSISYSPSASVLVLASDRARSITPKGSEQILAVGNPKFDRQRYNFLADLKDAEKEARQIRDFYNLGTVFVGPAATKRKVLAEMPHADLVHLALHSIDEPNAEMHSRLVLATEQHGSDQEAADDVLEAREIYDLRLPTTRLVVLSACQTGTGRYYRGEGTYSIARAFLVSGVPTVVASLWPVDSEATAELMINFHQIRKQGRQSTAESLRQAQLKMLRSGDSALHHPYYWAAFSVFGGSESTSVPTK